MSKVDLYKGDCLQVMDELIAKGIIVDAIITDPPYGTTACKWDTVIPFDEMWLRLNKLIKPNGAIVLFGSEPFSSLLRVSNLKMYRYDIIWNKISTSSGILAKKRPLNAHELMSIFYKKQPFYNPQMQKGIKWSRGGKMKKSAEVYGEVKNIGKPENDETDLKYPKQIITFSNANRNNRVHPTQKPVALMEYLIKTYTNENETVLDFTMGSGTTGVACKNINRNFIGIEMDDKYFDIAENRIKDEGLNKGLFGE